MAIPAKCCRQALQDATARWPNRNRASDGILGDAAHQKRKSDHNLGNAYDLTHDPANGVDCHVLSRQVINDPRVTYVIWNRRIYNRQRAALGWRNYTGPNPHTKHMHVSIRAAARDTLTPWPWSAGGTAGTPTGETGTETTTPTSTGRRLRLKDRGPDVSTLQQRLVVWRMMSQEDVDGIFGPNTLAVVKEFQRRHGLEVDGIVGPNTWRALFDNPPPVPPVPKGILPTRGMDDTELPCGLAEGAPQSKARAKAARKSSKKGAAKSSKKGGKQSAKKGAKKGAAKKRGRK
jgi:hypothetical protein